MKFTKEYLDASMALHRQLMKECITMYHEVTERYNKELALSHALYWNQQIMLEKSIYNFVCSKEEE